MSDKSARRTTDRRPGMTLKEKPAAKKAKKDVPQRQVVTAERR